MVGTQRTLQVVLGLFWILDAALQFQPYMFGKGFVNDTILVNASGQPAFIAAFITHIGHFISPDVAVWNTLFAVVQVVIGVGLLYRPTVRPALGLSFVWALGVWVIGEGLGMLFTGTASALTGAPGSVLVYGLIGLMAWPRRRAGEGGESDLVGVASSAAGQGIGGVVTPLAVWSGYWVLAAVLFLLPDNRTQTSVSSAITGMALGTPGFYDHFLTSLGNSFNTTGTQTSWVLAVVSLVIGLGPLMVRRPSGFLLAGGIVAALLWMTGQGWLGNIFTGSGTDPNTGPVIILLALAMVPAALATASAPTPFAWLVHRVPTVAYGGLAVIVAAILLSVTYPVAAHETTDAAMAGMTMSGGSASSDPATSSASTSTCVAHQSGLALSGEDLNNTPYMIMGGNSVTGMDMNGADASAAAGLNTTKVNWHYTGPALSNTLANLLLDDGANNAADIHMAISGCAHDVTAAQEINATQYVQATSQSAARYPTPADAEAAGYVAVSPTNYPVVTYVNPAIVASNAAAKRTLSPGHIDGLVYATIPSGETVLVAAMYILPSTVTSVPMPFGPMVQWHERTDVCGPATKSATTPFDITGFPPCAAGTVRTTTPYITMVWQVPVAGGPLAIQPPDIQIVEAAIMAAS
jgi:hypothetical protein